MIKTLFKKEWKYNYKIFLIFISVITLYGSIIVAMFDPTLGESLQMMAESMPQLFSAFGMSDSGSNMIEFVNNYLYGFILIVVPFIYIVIMCQRLIGRYEDKGSMAYLLATPHTRTKVILTQLFVLLSGILLLVLYAFCLILLCNGMMFDESIPIKEFIVLNIGLLGMQSFFGAMCYLSMCAFHENKYALGIGTGAGIFFILVQMLSQVSDKMEWLNYLTPLTLFNRDGLIELESQAIFQMGILFVLAIILMVLGTYLFKQKDLSI